MKRVIAAVLLATPAAAFALSAQGYEMMKQDCGFIGSVAGKAYDKAQMGGRERVPDDMQDDPMYTMMVWAADFGGKASDRDTARRMAIAKCVDNFERIHRDWRYGIKTDPTQFR